MEDEARKHPVVHALAADAETGVQVVSRVAGPLTEAIRKSGKCPCPEEQCSDANSVRVLIVPFTQGAHLFRVVEGSTPVKSSVGELPPDFARVRFPNPDSFCWVWDVIAE